MSMITCSECNNEMSDSAQACPKCDKPNINAPVGEKKVGCLFAIGIFLFPMICFWFTLRKGYSTSLRIIAFVWLGVFGLVVIISDSNSLHNSEITHDSPIVNFKPEQIHMVSLRRLLSSYKNNKVGADNLYKGKLIQITGVIDSVKKDTSGNHYVILGTGLQSQTPQVQAFFSDANNEKLGQLPKGARLTIVGRVDGLKLNVLVKDCQIK